uniref:Uncharacterized protein n=1 Tax=Arcella intermedia TaxID=1963864 RepID=A0A6B2L7I9_9EUKA
MWWKGVIVRAVEETKRPVFDFELLRESFKWNGVSPVDLQHVIDKMIESGDVVRREEFEREYFGVSVQNWLLSTFKSYFFQTQKEEYILKSILIQQANQLLKYAKQTKNEDSQNLYLTLNEIESKFNYLEYTLPILKHQKQMEELQCWGRRFFKFNQTNEPVSVTPMDQFLLQFKILIEMLEKQENTYKVEIQRIISKVKEENYLKSKTTLPLLARKRKLEELIYQKRQIKHNLMDVLASIEAGHTNHKIMEVLKSGNEVLKNLNEELSLEGMEKVIDEWTELKQNLDDFSEAFTNSQLESQEMDSDQLQQELDALIHQDNPLPVSPKQHTKEEQALARQLQALSLLPTDPQPPQQSSSHPLEVPLAQ